MSRELRGQGFRWSHGMNYNPLRSGVPELAEWFGRHVEDVMRISGAKRVHLVGHSLGGVIARWYIQELGGEKHVDTCVTIGTPHHGTVAAYLGIGPAAQDMRPGSDVIDRLHPALPQSKTTYLNPHSHPAPQHPPAAARHADRRDDPQARGGSEAAHVCALTDDCTGTEEADAGDDLRSDTRWVGFRAAKRREAVNAHEREQTGTDRHEDV